MVLRRFVDLPDDKSPLDEIRCEKSPRKVKPRELPRRPVTDKQISTVRAQLL